MSSAGMADSHKQDLTPELPELWRQGELCDVTLVSAQGQVFRAHKIILAAASRYFQALFVGGGKHLLEGSRAGGNETRVQLDAIDSASLATVLRCIYDKQVDMDADSVQGLLLAANYLDVPAVRDACCQVSAPAHACFVMRSTQTDGSCSDMHAVLEGAPGHCQLPAHPEPRSPLRLRRAL